ncbi:radial spoke head protein 6 homolog A-like [Denticeps clupeoides]|uniref:radial spoke head protein 6 homolog A-like n=1 Tax=Denticeps clupeoides TaxID=299321 RepID=UPI0010A2E693|nr:radial spoke head protein 6 homolog A-like [Denticeps clupeoides]
MMDARTEKGRRSWVHHVPHILTQGRCVWVNPAEKPAAEPDEDEEEEEEPEREEGPAIFTPLSEDAEIDRLPPWSSRLSSALVPRFAVAVARHHRVPVSPQEVRERLHRLGREERRGLLAGAAPRPPARVPRRAGGDRGGGPHAAGGRGRRLTFT